jgi:uncharacterized protein YjbI with pentapeptide repeats
MKTITKEELQDVLKSHKDWLNGIDGGVRADLSYTDLSGANLYKANLYKANLEEYRYENNN